MTLRYFHLGGTVMFLIIFITTISRINSQDSSDVPSLYDCDFESGFCGWQQYTSRNVSWKTHTTQSADGSGPTVDHTGGKGSVAYIDVPEPVVNRTLVSLTSAIVPKGGWCFGFFYYMSRGDVDELAVIKTDDVFMKTTETIFESTGGKGPRWVGFTQNFNATVNFTLSVIASIGVDFDGDIAIDDVTLKPGACASIDPNEITTTCKFQERQFPGQSDFPLIEPTTSLTDIR